jgi:shikimate kinase
LTECLWRAQKTKYAHRPALGKKRGLVIVGGSGAGKTTLATVLAKRMGVEGIDLDERIAQKTKMSIAELFGMGEAHFRDFEANCLPECIERPAVLALGAGAWHQEPIRRLVTKSGWDVLWLAENPATTWGRVGGDPARPLASDRAEFMHRWRSRMAEWSLLPSVLPLGRTPEELAELLVQD